MAKQQQWMELNRKGRSLPIFLIECVAHGFRTYFAGNHDGRTKLTHFRQAFGGRGFTVDMFDRYVRMYSQNQVKIIPWMQTWVRLFRQWMAFSQRLYRIDVRSVSTADIIGLLKKYRDMTARATTFAYDYRICGQFLPQEVRQTLAARVGNDRKADKYLADIIHLSKPIDVHNEQIAIRKIAIRSKRSSYDLDRALRRHAVRYGYLAMYLYQGRPHQPSHYLPIVRKLRKRTVRQLTADCTKINKRFADNRRAIRTLINTYDFTAAEQKKIKQLRFLNDVSMICDEYYTRVGAYTLPLLLEIGRRCGLSQNQTVQLTIPELVTLLQGTTSSDRMVSIANQRIDDHALILEHNRIRILIGAELKQYGRGYQARLRNIKAQKIITGEVAYPGTVTGRVMLIRDVEDIHTFQKGFILVTGATAPQYVPAMKKAKAIITDEGGMLSHAAIMSREFQKPCVIGTQVATRSLRNGQRVEVDAERGIVRKLHHTSTSQTDTSTQKPQVNRAKSRTRRRRGARATKGLVRKI